MAGFFRRIAVPFLACLLLLAAGCASRTAETGMNGAGGADTGAVEFSGENDSRAVVTGTGSPLLAAAQGGAVPGKMAGDAADEFEDYGDEDEPLISDPLEPWNRFWFKFNNALLLDVVKPVYKGYTAITPECLRNGLSNAWHNLLAPVRIVNRILQGEFAMAWVELGRFMINTTIGFGGLGQVAQQKKVLVPFDENGGDFGHTLEVWGFGEGCYLVWPFIGPSTLRDTVGFAGDTVASPTFWGCGPVGPVPESAGWITSGTLRFNDMGSVIKNYETIVNSSVEPYSAVRDAYVRLRRADASRARKGW